MIKMSPEIILVGIICAPYTLLKHRGKSVQKFAENSNCCGLLTKVAYSLYYGYEHIGSKNLNNFANLFIMV